MAGQHVLVLPLPPTYAANEREHFSFFTSAGAPSSRPDSSPLVPNSTTDRLAEDAPDDNPLTRYLDDLCDVLRRTRLIQRHPDKYFQYVRGEEWRAGAHHLDGSPVTKEELAYTNELCDAFAPIIDGGDGSLAAVRQLLREGPPPGSDPSLVRFHSECRRLMLHRVPRPEHDAARFTLLQTSTARATLARQRAAETASEARRREILDLVLSYGMNAKKQHEVVIMRDTIRDLVDCANVTARAEARPPHAEGHQSDVVRSVINVGEGKGYVSRALALCDGLHVIGLDCNPAHRERAIERFETLVEGSLSLRPTPTLAAHPPASATRSGKRCGKDMIALLYAPRGDIASVACRVDARADWRNIFQGHTPTVEDGAPMLADVEKDVGRDSRGTVGGRAGDDHDGVGGDGSSRPSAALPVSAMLKGRCRVCQRIFPLDKTLVVMRHVHRHCAKELAADGAGVVSDPQQRSAHRLPSGAELKAWHRDLPQAQLQARLLESFFEPVDLPSRRHGTARGQSAGMVGENTETESTPERSTSCTDAKRHRPECGLCEGATQTPGADGALAVATVARGLRVTVLVPGRRHSRHKDDSVTRLCDAGKLCSPTSAGDEVSHRRTNEGDVPNAYRVIALTVVGRDDATGAHMVIYDDGTQKEHCLLLRVTASALSTSASVLMASLAAHDDSQRCAGTENRETEKTEELESVVRALGLPDADVWSAEQKALILRVHEPYRVTVPAVRVPSLSNTVFVGLHTCGDLGSNTCRLFIENRSRGLLLVSCCWHALTSQGFPLSQALRDRHMTTDKVSLLLATQPLDMWATASAEGHRSSARLLFFRTLLIMLWASLRREWEATTAARTCDCPFAPEPHLEPGFLRRVNKVKETVSFPEFAEQVCAEYIYAATAKCNAYTWHNTVCEQCRTAQEALFHARVHPVSSSLAETYMPSHFPRFLGLTVLRMWMCHLVESLFLLDRALYLHEELVKQGGSSSVSLVPLFDGATSPRMYGILALRASPK